MKEFGSAKTNPLNSEPFKKNLDINIGNVQLNRTDMIRHHTIRDTLIPKTYRCTLLIR